MKKLGAVLLGITAALPLYAQDTAPATSPEEVPAGGAPDSSTPPESTTPPADQSAAPPADQSATPTEDSSATPQADQSAPPTDETAAAPADASTTDTTTPTDQGTPPTDQSTTATDQGATPTDQGMAADQATPPTDESAASAEATPPAESAPYDSTVSTETPPVEESAPVEASVDTTSTEAEPAEESNPWIFYVGASYGTSKVSISEVSGFASEDTTTRTIQGRVGVRITDGLGIEGHFGKGLEDDDTPNQTMLDTYYGIYFVPTGIVLDAVEFGFPLGFAWTKIRDGNTSVTLDGVSYGMNVEFPLKLISETVPDLRVVGGGMVYQQNNSARTYGWHAGLRWDFAI